MAEQRLFPIDPSSSAPASLFPISNKTVSQGSADQDRLTWLSNASFSETLLPAPTPIPDWYVQELEIEKQEDSNVPISSAHPLITSFHDDDEDNELHHVKESSYDSGDSDEKRKRRREETFRLERKKKRKKKKIGDQDHKTFGFRQGSRLRGSSKRWVDVENKDFQFDVRGDRDNLVYDSLYRQHVPIFYRHQTRIQSRRQGKSVYSFFGFKRVEEDDVVMDEKLREGRYWSTKFISMERRKDLSRIKILLLASKPTAAKRPYLFPPGDFILLEDFDINEELKASHSLLEESWDDYVTRKTREFNQQTRERPQDESLWIAFANFQDVLIKAAVRKAVSQQAVEKKIAVLEKALEIHPYSEDLWLLYLDTSHEKDLASALLSKWEKAIKCIPQSYQMWKGYLHFRLGEFSMFTVSSIRKSYMQAIQTYFAAHDAQDHAEKTEIGSRAETERNLVLFFVDLCRFEWQTGHNELAIGLFQALIEYNLFSPPIDVSERSKRRLFKEFWDGGAPRVGENGASGWASWLQKEEEWLQKSLVEDKAEGGAGEEMEPERWTGWDNQEKDVELASVDVSILEDVSEAETPIAHEDEDLEMRDFENNEEDETILLERLGLSLQTENEVEVKDSATWKRWSEKEHDRDSTQWLPVHIRNKQ